MKKLMMALGIVSIMFCAAGCGDSGDSSGSGSGGDGGSSGGSGDCVQACTDYADAINACIVGLGAAETDYSATCSALDGACGVADYEGYYNCLADVDDNCASPTDCTF